MTRKHFEYAAGVVNAMVNRDNARIAANAYIVLFSAFNPLFNTPRFLLACGL